MAKAHKITLKWPQRAFKGFKNKNTSKDEIDDFKIENEEGVCIDIEGHLLYKMYYYLTKY